MVSTITCHPGHDEAMHLPPPDLFVYRLVIPGSEIIHVLFILLF